MIDLVFEASIADVLDDYIADERLKDALFGQGVIGTWGGPTDPGTASIKLMHYQGDLDGQGPVWGYVEGGMGMISFAIADAAREAGAVARLRRARSPRSSPARASGLEDGTTIRARDRDLQRRPEGRRCGLLGDAEIDARLPRAARGLEGPQPGRQVQRLARRGCRTGPPPPARTGRRGRRSTSPAAIDEAQRGVRSAATPASPRSGSARSTSRPATTRRPAPAGQAPDERLRPVRALRPRRGRLGLARAATSSASSST